MERTGLDASMELSSRGLTQPGLGHQLEHESQNQRTGPSRSDHHGCPARIPLAS